MKTEVNKKSWAYTIHIDPFKNQDEEEWSPWLFVSKEKDVVSDQWKPAQVNWRALGSVSPDRAAVYGQGILVASGIARMLDIVIEEEKNERSGS